MDAAAAAVGDGPEVTVANEIYGNALNVAVEAEIKMLVAEGNVQMAQEELIALGRR